MLHVKFKKSLCPLSLFLQSQCLFQNLKSPLLRNIFARTYLPLTKLEQVKKRLKAFLAVNKIKRRLLGLICPNILAWYSRAEYIFDFVRPYSMIIDHVGSQCWLPV